MTRITDFRTAPYEFLSNMYSCKVIVNGFEFKSAEAAFQAGKAKSVNDVYRFTQLNGYAARKLGRAIDLRSDWEQVKDKWMYFVVKSKFEQNPILATRLINTGDAELIEVNTWGDTYWGICRGKGENKLGRILMRIREELKNVKCV